MVQVQDVYQPMDGTQTEGTYFIDKAVCANMNDPLNAGGFIFDHLKLDNRTQDIRLECLKMATLHATKDQIETGAVYKIAEDYYDYVINGKKLINNQ